MTDPFHDYIVTTVALKLKSGKQTTEGATECATVLKTELTQNTRLFRHRVGRRSNTTYQYSDNR